MSRCRWPFAVLLLAAPFAMPQETPPPTAMELGPAARIDPGDPAEEILYRQLDLWHHPRNRDRVEEILERLWLAGSGYYCPALARLGNNARLRLDAESAVAWYRRAVRECAGTGWALLGLSEIAASDPRFCSPAREAAGEDITALAGRRLPHAAAEGSWTPDELEYFRLVGTSTIRMVCGDGAVGRRELEDMVEFRGRYSFGSELARVRPYVEAMVRADLGLRAGRRAEASRALREAVRRVCRARGLTEVLVDATPREGGAPLAFNVNLGAVGLFEQLWDMRMLERLDGDSRRCLQDMLHALRRQFRDDPETSQPEVREWYADLDRRLRRGDD